jgi:hypothetical protein
MTAPLHHINQMILHLPAMGGYMAAQAVVGEEMSRIARLEEAKTLYRDTVEIVTEAKETIAIEPIRPELERKRGRKAKKWRQAKAAEQERWEFDIEPVVDFKV